MNRGAKRSAPSHAPFPHHAGRHQGRRRTCAARWRRAASWSAAGCGWGWGRSPPSRGPYRYSPARWRRPTPHPSPWPGDRGKRWSRRSCARCPRAPAGTAVWPAKRLFAPGAPSRWNPCRRKTAGPAAQTAPPPHASHRWPRPPVARDGSVDSFCGRSFYA